MGDLAGGKSCFFWPTVVLDKSPWNMTIEWRSTCLVKVYFIFCQMEFLICAKKPDWEVCDLHFQWSYLGYFCTFSKNSFGSIWLLHYVNWVVRVFSLVCQKIERRGDTTEKTEWGIIRERKGIIGRRTFTNLILGKFS